jgi:hypothetical protein
LEYLEGKQRVSASFSWGIYYKWTIPGMFLEPRPAGMNERIVVHSIVKGIDSSVGWNTVSHGPGHSVKATRVPDCSENEIADDAKDNEEEQPAEKDACWLV